jgi:hypothetical protein
MYSFSNCTSQGEQWAPCVSSLSFFNPYILILQVVTPDDDEDGTDEDEDWE